MKLFAALPTFVLSIILSFPASAAHHSKKKKKSSAEPTPAAQVEERNTGEEDPFGPTKAKPADTSAETPAAAARPSATDAANQKSSMDFDFFGEKGGAGGEARSPGLDLSPEAQELKQQGQTRRWMLTTHQTLGIATWILMAATVTVGQLNYNQLYGGGGGSNKWQTPHEVLVGATTLAFAATGAFALFAPSPYKKPLHFDTGLVHRMAVAGATLGMLTEVFLGWWTTHQGDAGNPNNLRTMARTHQVVGWSTFGFLTVAGAVWVF